MNSKLQDFARTALKDGLRQCTEEQQTVFKRMYSHNDLMLPIEEVVDKIEPALLDWAMQQVERTIIENRK
jgi:hypothetical protein